MEDPPCSFRTGFLFENRLNGLSFESAEEFKNQLFCQFLTGGKTVRSAACPAVAPYLASSTPWKNRAAKRCASTQAVPMPENRHEISSSGI